MEFTYNQKMAIVKILMEIISADGKIDVRETFYFEKVKKELALDSSDHYKINGLNSLVCLSTIKSMEDDQKHVFAEMMKTMILADEEINENESIIFDNVCSFCAISNITPFVR